VKKLAAIAGDLLAPDLCLACDTGEASDSLKLCRGCRSRLRTLEGSRCLTCARPLAARGEQCVTCIVAPTPWQRLFVLWEYRSPGDAVVHGLKFSRLEGLGATLAARLWDRFAEDLSAADVVVAIPLPWPRRLLRGFNQSESIARPLAQRLGLPLKAALRRRPARALSLAPHDERLRLARRSLGLRDARAVRGRTVLLVDDVVTTGATLWVATQLLRRAGAREVLAAAPFGSRGVADGALRGRI
jgi:ComF family protein